MTCHLHFTFGPVQCFVAQARRTRDLYSGSFLLSWLAYTAMKAVDAAGGEITLPGFAAVKKLVEAKKVKHGVAPNRFVAAFADEQQVEQAAKAAANALQKEWRTIAEAVWEKFAAKAAPSGNDTAAIWKRQIGNFWEIAWAIGGESETVLLGRRKNWRTPPLTIEGGDHCTLMGQYQELSGFVRSKEHVKQNEFWKKIRGQLRNKLNLDDDERLCAIALVKRFFPEIANEIVGYELDADRWPSTVDLAAKPFFDKIKSNEKCVETLRDFPKFKGDHFGQYMNRAALANRKATPFDDEDERGKYRDMLRTLEKAVNDRGGNFYALLLMDGDSMGKLIQDKPAETVTGALTAFSAEAPKIVHKYDGVCVYAGGDDLFALLPLDMVLDCSVEVSKEYKKSFRKHQISEATISAAVIFAHYSVPLRQVIAQAHHFLDDVAKDATERDAIAIAVLKPGGETCSWAKRFDRFQPTDAAENCFKPLIDKFREEGGDIDTLSSKFLYNLRRRFAVLEKDPSDFTADDLVSLFTAELIHGKLDKKPEKARQEREMAKTLIGKLVDICLDANTQKLDFDGARLVRFLALDGKEGNDR
ncbi:MAG: type III-B CRISPR-associated protein Cas10/Cmr2 [Desulfobacteraceae bacterium]|nr:MAG: type III-B CRISPR-associated protein Cas10/Cmr2 [Desulfobacteraceae bacterium]